jgi:hypothetical protein
LNSLYDVYLNLAVGQKNHSGTQEREYDFVNRDYMQTDDTPILVLGVEREQILGVPPILDNLKHKLS